MLISAVCPRCRTTYYVQDSLAGKAMRCQVSTCRHVFLVEVEVKADPAKPAPAEPASQRQQQSGAVGDLVPLELVEEVDPGRTSRAKTHVGDLLEMLPAESAAPVAPQPPAEDRYPLVRSWEDGPPPPRERKPRQPEPEPRREEKVTPEKPAPVRTRGTRTESPAPASDEPRVVKFSDLEVPPEQRDRPDEPITTRPREFNDPSPETSADIQLPPPPREEPVEKEEEYSHQPRSRWAKWIILPLMLLTVGVLTGGVILIIWTVGQSEDWLSRKAQDAFDLNQFNTAGQYYEQLIKKYENSEKLPFYEFRRDVSKVLYEFTEPPEDIRELLAHYEKFLTDRQQDPQLSEHGSLLASSLVKLLVGYSEKAVNNLTDDSPLLIIEDSRSALALAKRIKQPKGAEAKWEEVDNAFARLKQAIARMKARQALIARLTKLVEAPSYDSIVAFDRVVHDAQAEFPNLGTEADVTALRDKLYEGHRQSVRYTEAAAAVKDRVPVQGDSTLLVDPLLPGFNPSRRNDPSVALALVRGVLYALDRSTGQVRWALRLGIDTTALPVIVPRRVGIEELILALSSDTETLLALDNHGQEVWRYRPGKVLGRPVVVGQRAYLATYQGEVHEIELLAGKLLGRYHLGGNLTLGGTHEPRSNRVYFPATAGCVYVLDVEKRRCEAILYTRHPAGSLRSEVVVVPPEGDDAPGYLVLDQAAGLDGIKLRVWQLPLEGGQSRERQLTQAAELKGWTWFPPVHDAEKMVLVSDVGQLGLFGIRQAHNQDQPLFPLLPSGTPSLDALLWPGSRSKTPGMTRARTEVAQVQGDDLWILAAGRLQRTRLAWGQSEGPRLVSVWPDALTVGSPVHASQKVQLPTGKTNLVLVTRPEGRSCVWASCVDDETGQQLWRRQLGLVCQGEPLPVGIPDGPPVWLFVDQSGALFGIDPDRLEVGNEERWLSLGRSVFLADSLPDNADWPPLLLPSADGSVHCLACPGEGELVLRTVTPAPGTRQVQVSEKRVRLLHPLAGRPVLMGSQLILPLADGSLSRLTLPLPKEAHLEAGTTNWRGEQAGPDARCHLVAVGPSRFISSNGARGLWTWDWPADGAVPTPLFPGREEGPTLEVNTRITGLARLPDNARGEVQLAMTDSTGGLTLLQVLPTGAIQVRERIDLGGVITQGPMVHLTKAGPRVGCIVDRYRLLWIDPATGKILWSHETPGTDPIVGEPRLVDDVVLIADQSGLYVGLEAKSGKAIGKGYQLRGSISPAACPVQVRKDHLLAPLSDGTLLLVPLARLREQEP